MNIQEIINEEYEKMRHTYYGTDMGFDWNKYGVDDEITVLFKDGISRETIDEFLTAFKNARNKIENLFKLKLGRAYNVDSASYKIWFGKNVVIDNDTTSRTTSSFGSDVPARPAGEFVRTEAEHSPSDSYYFNIPLMNDTVKQSQKDWIPNPSYKDFRSRTFNVNKVEDLITHEIAHALYFQQPMDRRMEWNKYYDNGGWENASSLYAQESAMEMFAETIVDIVNDENYQITEDLKRIFRFNV